MLIKCRMHIVARKNLVISQVFKACWLPGDKKYFRAIQRDAKRNTLINVQPFITFRIKWWLSFRRYEHFLLFADISRWDLNRFALLSVDVGYIHIYRVYFFFFCWTWWVNRWSEMESHVKCGDSCFLFSSLSLVHSVFPCKKEFSYIIHRYSLS